MKKCIYCLQEKEDKEFTDEHIWPKSLGGGLLPHNLWRTNNVCKNCNNKSGLYVDAEFINGFLGKWYEYNDFVIRYIIKLKKENQLEKNIENLKEYIIFYLGYKEFEDLLTHFWVGPCENFAIQITEKDETFIQYIGGNPTKLKKSYIYILNSRKNFWGNLFEKALKRKLKGKIIKVQKNSLVVKNESHEKAIKNVLDELKKEKVIKSHININSNHGYRFMCKVAIALGHKLFYDFEKQIYSKYLYECFKGNLNKEILEKINALPYLENKFNGFDMFYIYGCWTLAIIYHKKCVFLLSISPKKYKFFIRINDGNEKVKRKCYYRKPLEPIDAEVFVINKAINKLLYSGNLINFFEKREDIIEAIKEYIGNINGEIYMDCGDE